ncbi:hypothetical protein KY332_04595 [Candidatus Woesearchaeota archaeon]|nr:hypothetical protein [Candidatus Woesearchaeota archaeon]
MKEKNFYSEKLDSHEITPLPDDAEVFAETAGYKVLSSKKQETLVIHTQDYHAGDLYLPKKDLEELLRKIE